MKVKKKINIMIVDDDHDFRKLMKGLFVQKGFNVHVAQHAKEAMAMLGPIEIDIILSDIRMPEIHGVVFLAHVKKNYPGIKFILMTGFQDIISVEQAYKFGANGFLTKPFSANDLDKALIEALGKDSEDLFKKSSADGELFAKAEYCEMSIDEFISGSKIQYPIYLKLSEEKMVKVANHGENISVDLLNRLKIKGIKVMYMLQDDYKDYVKFLSKLSTKVKDAKNIDNSRKKNFYQNTSKHILNLGLQESVTPELFSLAKTNLEVTVEIYAENDKHFSLLNEMMELSKDLYGHSLSVSLLSTMIAKQIGWHSSDTLFLVSSAGLFHDIGKKNLSFPLNKKMSEMNAEELELYQKHPQVGAEIIEGFGFSPAGLSQIIHHHHENNDGSGFPSGIGRVRIHPIAKILNVADSFLHKSDEIYQKTKILPRPAEVFAELEKERTKFELEYYNALQIVFAKALN